MNLKSFANFQPFNELRSEMGASQLGDFDVSRPLACEAAQQPAQPAANPAPKPKAAKHKPKKGAGAKASNNKPAAKKANTADGKKSNATPRNQASV